MNKTYKLLTKNTAFIFLATLLSIFLGLLTFLFYFDSTTSTIAFGNVIPILFILSIVGTLALSVLTTVKAKHFGVSKIKRSSSFFKFSSYLVCAMLVLFFFYDLFIFILQPAQITFLRSVRIVLFIPMIAHIVISVLPNKIKRTKIEISQPVRIVAGIGAVLWAVVSLLTVYFDYAILTNNVFKTILIFVYLLASLFFLYDAKFILIKPCPKPFVLSSLALFIVTFSFTLGALIARMFGKTGSLGISEFEIIVSLALGIYAFSKLCAFINTMKFIMENSYSSYSYKTSSSKKSSKSSDSEKKEAEKKDEKAKSEKKAEPVAEKAEDKPTEKAEEKAEEKSDSQE